mgnify:CR=1 FL=1
MKRVYVAEDTLEGIFSAIYDAWKTKRDADGAGIALKGQMEWELFCEYTQTEPDRKKAAAVERMIKKHLGMETYKDICYALLSEDEKKADAVLGTMQAARKILNSTKIMEHLACPAVQKVFALSRKVSNEAHCFIEFVRFKEMKNGILAARITPKNRILTCIAGHFADRFPNEDFLIHDETHRIFLVHRKGRPWFLLESEETDFEMLKDELETEEKFANLWKIFHTSISIKERENPKLQMSHFPLRYRANVLEFDEK